jgi:hypothetical protein
MSSKDKLVERFNSFPSDFSFDELVRLMGGFGFTLSHKGATSGSRVRLERGSDYYNLHRPHPTPIIKPGALKAAYAYLKRLKLI